jgi:capsular polysaccharide transport system ATP-binding protein
MIELQNVCKVYRTRQGSRRVLDDINLRVDKGQHLGMFGRNGSGKSTLIRLIGGVERPTLGRIERHMTLSWPLAFTGAFQPMLTGVDNVRFVCRVYDVKAADVLPFIEDFAELGMYMREPLYRYSSGMLARLAFAVSLAIEFECFLIDEITAVGDERFHEKCRIELFDKRKDRAFILVTHDAAIIDNYCNRAGVIVDGTLRCFDNIPDAHVYFHETNLRAA